VARAASARRWLYGDTLDKPHGFEISSIKVDF